MAADPYLAVTLDVKRRIAQVARVLELPHPGPAAWGLWELLEDVWRRKEPSVTALLLAACFGPDQRWPGVLVEFGFLVVKGTAWELCAEEADRLLRTHRQRVAAGKARTASGKRSAGGRLQRATSGSPANDQRPASGPPAADLLSQPAASSQQPAPEEEPVLVLKEQASGQKPPRRRSEAQEFWDHYQQERQRLHGWIPEAELEPVVLNAWFKDVLGKLSGQQEAPWERLWRAAAHFLLEDQYWTAPERKSPFKAFMTEAVWRKHVPRTERAS